MGMLKGNTSGRPSWDEYFLNLAYVVKSRSNCLRQSVGVVIVKEKHIIATGYNGTPFGVKNCFEGGCQRCWDREHNGLGEGQDKHLCICIHAEQNAILQSAYHGTSTKGAVLYSTTAPCIGCAKHLLNAGIKEVVYAEEYTDSIGIDLLKEAGVLVRKSSK
jgi:dCMP deaminase